MIRNQNEFIMKKIIVPVDFSKHSEFALKSAAALAKKYDLSLYVLHMLDIHEISISESPSLLQEKAAFYLKMAEKKFKTFLKKDFLKGIKVIPVIKHNKVFSEVNTVAEEVAADLIIMGSHGVSGLKEFFVGSNTEKVVRYSNVPVLVIKNELTDVKFNDIVFATDFSKKSIPSFQKMIKMLDFLKAKTHLLYVNLPSEKFKTSAEMDALATSFLLETEGNLDRMVNVHLVCDRSIEDGILNYSNLVGADLITLVTHGRKGLSHIFAGSVAEDVANHANLPIMTYKI